MNSLSFRKTLRSFRMKTHYLKTNKPLTQQELGDFLHTEIGIRYSGAAVSDWERGASKIHADNLPLLIAIIKILKRYDGIKNVTEANQLLRAGNFRNLSVGEQKEIFPDDSFMESTQHQERISWFKSFFVYLFFDSLQEFSRVREKANEGPPPVLPRLVVAIIRQQTDKLSPQHFLHLILWVWIMVGAYWLIVPSFNFPFATQQDRFQSMLLYVIGTLVLPLAIGFMFNTKNNSYWKAQALDKPVALRVYVLLGAYMGFHVSYFLIFLPTFILNHFQIHFGAWLEVLKLLFILIISYASAQLIPYNFWLAYQRLNLKDGNILFTFMFLGIFWAWFFLEFYDTLILSASGLIILLIAITLMIMIEIYRNHKKKNTR